MDLLCVYLGDRLGMYRALADAGPSTSAELASAAGVNERYAREWLEQQAMTGILEAVDPHASDAERRYAVPAGHDEVLLDGASLNHMAPMAQLLVACALPIHAVLDAFRTGDGVPYADYGADLHDGQARFTQPLLGNLLASDWLPAVPSIHDRLNGDPPARVADIACGLGRSSIAIARSYPETLARRATRPRALIVDQHRRVQAAPESSAAPATVSTGAPSVASRSMPSAAASTTSSRAWPSIRPRPAPAHTWR
jgi:hypothetical protein